MIKRAPFAKWRFPTCPKRKIRGKLRANRGIRYFPRRIILPLPSPPPPQVTNLPSKIYLGAVREEFKAWAKIIDLDLFNFRRLWCCFVRQDIKYDKGGVKKDSNRLLYTDIFKKKSIESKGREMHEDAWEREKLYPSSIEKLSIRFRVGGGIVASDYPTVG